VARASAITALFTAVLFGVAACSGASDTPAAPELTADDQATTQGPVAPLTGLPAVPADLNRPALSAKIDNHPAARPQVALDEADIVFEELVEGGLTRYVAIWHSQVPSEIGPVRSIRPMDPVIVSPFGGIMAYSGGQQRFVEAMKSAPVANAVHGEAAVADFFYRSNDKVAPHNVIVRADDLVESFGELSPPQQQFMYAPSASEATAVVRGEPTSSFITRFSSFQAPGWAWSVSDGSFVRSQTNGAADVALSGNRIRATNVVTLFVEIQVIRDIPTTLLVASGEGFVATGGFITPVVWAKDEAGSVISLRDTTGRLVTLAPGNTWVELLPAPGSGVPAGTIDID